MNATTLAGGGLYIHAVQAAITRGSFDGNRLEGGGTDLLARGGGIAFDELVDTETAPELVLEGTTFKDNAIDLGSTGTGYGGAIWFIGASLYADSTLRATGIEIESSAIVANSGIGAGMMFEPNAEGSVTARLELSDSSIHDNTIMGALGRGGGLAITAPGASSPGFDQWSLDASIERTQLLRNSITATSASGGGMDIHLGSYMAGQTVRATIAVAHSTIADNTLQATQATGGGMHGKIYLGNAQLLVSSSTIDRNRAQGTTSASGGGLAAIDSLSTDIVDSTISGNTAQATAGKARGGGIGVESLTHLRYRIWSSTITGNTGAGSDPGGGGFYLYGEGDHEDDAAYFELANTILARNLPEAAPDCLSEIVDEAEFPYFPASRGHNLFGTNPSSCGMATSTGDLVGRDPLLAPLADNGGPTQTHALDPTSPAIDAGDPAGCKFDMTAIELDQRGMPRTNNGRCGIGAFER